jgi:peptidoglycan-associated lipoprotein
MKIALRLLLALMIAVALAACKTTPEADSVDTDTSTPTDTSTTPDVVTSAALDPRDYTSSQSAQNFDNPESLLSKRVIYFDFDKSDVKPEYRAIVSAHAAYAASHPSARITLEGHADERGTREYNLGLGERRGNGVNGLISAGGASGGQTSVVSYGEERPVCRVSDNSCWSQNRRVEIVYTAR